MGENVVKLETVNETSTLSKHMTEAEYNDFQKLAAHPATVGYILFDPSAEIIGSQNISENNAAAFANVFDICDDLTERVGQKTHVSTVFEGREMEITCRRLDAARLVVFRGKNRKAGV